MGLLVGEISQCCHADIHHNYAVDHSDRYVVQVLLLPFSAQLTCLTAGLNGNSPASFRSSQIIGMRGTASIAAYFESHRNIGG